MVGLCKTLVKEKRLFYYLESSHKIFYTTVLSFTQFMYVSLSLLHEYLINPFMVAHPR